MAAFNLDNQTMANFAFYSVVVTLKMFLLAFLTSFTRIGKGSYANAEDVKAFYKGNNPEKLKTNLGDQDVERVRRNHLNDLENIPAFIFVGIFYVLTNPSPVVALWHFRVFACSRILHTLAYQSRVQPWRALFFFGGLGSTVSMAIQVLMSTW